MTNSSGLEQYEDPLHYESGPGTAWTTTNNGEAVPGVLMPLTWTSFWDAPNELAVRAMFCDLGILRRRDVRFPESVDERHGATFHGRFASNLDRIRAMADLMPGTSGDAVEEGFYGTVRPGVVSQPSRRRYPAIAMKMPWTVFRLNGRMTSMRADVDAWWRRSTTPEMLADVPGAPARLAEAIERFTLVFRLHCTASMLAQAMYEQVGTVASAAGVPGAETRLSSGYGGLEETIIATDLWATARGELALDQFLARHGYNGPEVTHLHRPPWRERPEALTQLFDGYRALPESADPRTVELRKVHQREQAEAEVLGALPRLKRSSARLTLMLARRVIPLREVGRSAFLQVIDVGRAAVRALGQDLADRGIIQAPDDVFFLTHDELTRSLPANVAAVVAFRRQCRDEYLAMELPESWTGTPSPISAEPAVTSGGDALIGVGVSPGVVEGVARVVTDPGSTMLQPGEVLVCETTDPSWISLFFLAAAVVIDIGGPLSHGAIVTRELGIPCVINTRIGTRTIRTGDRIVVDGTAGRVETIATTRQQSAAR